MTDVDEIVIEPNVMPDPDRAAIDLAEERIDRAERELKEAICAWEKLVGGPYLGP